MDRVSTEQDIRDFLASRRARITPDRAGLPNYASRRRVAGLRREEVALLANISVEYYTRLERGHVRGVSDEVLDGVARALQLDDAERAHLRNLVRASNERPMATRPGQSNQESVRPAVRRIVDAMANLPAMVRNGRLDVVYANALGYALYSPMFDEPSQWGNPARFVFLDRRSHDFFVDWEAAASDMVGLLRAEAGRNPGDHALADLLAELSTHSAEFRSRWAEHGVLLYRTGTRSFQHPVVGDLTLTYEDLAVRRDPDLTVLVFAAEPSSSSARVLRRLARWASTQQWPS